MTSWKTYRLGEICDYATSRTTNIENYISTENMLPNKGGVCTPSNVPSGAAVEYKMGDILVSNIRPYFQKIWQADCNGACSADVLCIRSNDITDSNYLYYLLSQQRFFDYVMAGAKGCKMPRGDKKQILQWQISLPSLEEQRRIAAILGAIDDKIENNRRINTNLELQAQALYKQWFVDNRNDDWEVGKVSDYYDITIGKTPPRKEKQWFSLNSQHTTWVSISDMGTCGMYISDSSEYLTADAVSRFNIKEVSPNTVLLSFKLTIGRVAISNGIMTTNEAIAHFNTERDYLLEYTYLALKAYEFSNLGSTSSIATAVNSKIIKAMRWIMPEESVLRDFHNLVSPIFRQIKNNILENEKLTTLRDALLPN